MKCHGSIRNALSFERGVVSDRLSTFMNPSFYPIQPHEHDVAV